MTLELLRRRRILHQRKRQHDRFTILDGVKVMYFRFGEDIHSRTTEAAPSMRNERWNKTECRMAYRSPYPVRINVRCWVRNSPAEMKCGRSEYMLDRFSSKSTATRWLLITRTSCPSTLRYIISPERWVSTFLGELEVWSGTVFVLPFR